MATGRYFNKVPFAFFFDLLLNHNHVMAITINNKAIKINTDYQKIYRPNILINQ